MDLRREESRHERVFRHPPEFIPFPSRNFLR